MGALKLFFWMLLAHSTLPWESGAQELRLVNAWNRCAGRVEIFYQGAWGTVCDDDFYMDSAHVVCRQLGCGEAITVLGWSYFGRGSGDIVLDDVNCTGSELYLWNCQHAGWLIHDCGHNEDVSVICSESTNTEVPTPALLPTSDEASTYYTTPKAEEVFETTHTSNENETMSTTEVPQISLRSTERSEVTSAVNKNEETIPSGLPTTSHGATVELNTTSSPSVHETFPSTTQQNLLSSEILLPSTEKTVTTETFSSTTQHNLLSSGIPVPSTETSVTTETLPSTTKNPVTIAPKENTTPKAAGSSTLLPSTQKSSTSARHAPSTQSASANHSCGGRLSGPSGSFSTPLYPSNYPSNSRCVWHIEVVENRQVELLFEDFALEITSRCIFDFVEIFDGFSSTSPSLEKTCYKAKKIYISSSNKMQVVFSSDSSINDRGFYAVYREVPPKSMVTTKPTLGMKTTTVTDGALQLVNGRNGCEGRLEVFHNGKWGTVCDDEWDMNDAHVVCRQLGCGKALAAVGKAQFDQGSGPIFLDDISCTGNELSLEQCAHRGWGVHNCIHREDAAVVCSGTAQNTPPPPKTHHETPAEGALQLVNGRNRCEGRLEVFHNGKWGTVCDDEWDINNAHVACRQVGCGNAVSAVGKAEFGRGSGPIFLDDVSCPRNAFSLKQCSHRGWGIHNCNHREDAGVICSGATKMATTPVPVNDTAVDPVTLSCLPEYMKAVISRDYLISKCGSQCQLYLSDSACKPVIMRQHIIFYIPYDGCGTRRENTGSISSFSNTVSSSGSGINPQFRFTCKMEPRQMTEVTHSVDEYESTKQVQMQNTHIHVKFLFYDSPSFLHPWNNLPYFMNLIQDSFLQATLYSFNQDLILFTDTCVASPNAYDFTTERHVIVDRGCVRDDTYTGYFTQNRRATHFRFKPFRFFSRYSTVYLQCKMVVCRAYDYSSRCYQGCLSRNKREASSGQGQLQVLGPLKLDSPEDS